MPTATIISEGPADDAFLKALIDFRRLENLKIARPRPEEAYGEGGFQRRLEGLKLSGIENHRAIIIVADNDDTPAQSFANIQKQVHEAGDYSVPESPYQPSERGKYPSIAVMMLPAQGREGSLDTLCLSSVNPKYSRQLKCVDEIVNCLGADESTWGVVKLAKLRLQCLLSSICKGDPYTPLKCAWLNEPGKARFGDIFPLSDQTFDSIAGFLRNLTT